MEMINSNSVIILTILLDVQLINLPFLCPLLIRLNSPGRITPYHLHPMLSPVSSYDISDTVMTCHMSDVLKLITSDFVVGVLPTGFPFVI